MPQEQIMRDFFRNSYRNVFSGGDGHVLAAFDIKIGHLPDNVVNLGHEKATADERSGYGNLFGLGKQRCADEIKSIYLYAYIGNLRINHGGGLTQLDLRRTIPQCFAMPPFLLLPCQCIRTIELIFLSENILILK